MDTQGLPAPRPLLGQGGARPRCGPSLGTPIRGSSQAGFGARSCGLGATRSSPGRRRYRSRVRRVGVEAQHPWWGLGGAPPSPGAPRLVEGMQRERARGRALCFPSWRWLFVRERPRGCALSHCPSPRPRSLFFSFWWVWAWCLLPPVRGERRKRWSRPWEGSLGRRSPPTAPHFTEALLEADSSSLLAGWAAFLRLRGLERVAFRRLFGGLVEESSYSSAREKRSLNLEGSGDGVRRCQGRRGHRDGRRRLTSSCGLRRSWPGRAAGPAGWGFG